MSRVPCKPGCLCKKHQRTKRGREADLAARKAWMKIHREADPDNAADIFLRHKYGMSLARYDEILADQNGVCAICRSSDPGTGGRFCVDHDHRCCSGKRSCGECVRGLLCCRCNAGIAMFRDNPDFVRRALDYVSLF